MGGGLGRWLRIQGAILAACGRALSRRVRTPREGFGYARATAFRWLPWLVLLSLPADALLVGVLLPPRWEIVGWALFAVTLYTLAWTIGVYASMRERPHTVAAARVGIRLGLLAEAELAPANIISVQVHEGLTPGTPRAKAMLRGAESLLSQPGRFVELRLDAPAALARTWRVRPTSRLLVPADDAAALAAAIAEAQATAIAEAQATAIAQARPR